MEIGLEINISFSDKAELKKCYKVFQKAHDIHVEYLLSAAERTPATYEEELERVVDVVLDWLAGVGEQYKELYRNSIDEHDNTLTGITDVVMKGDTLQIFILGGGLYGLDFQQAFVALLAKIPFINKVNSKTESDEMQDLDGENVSVRIDADEAGNINESWEYPLQEEDERNEPVKPPKQAANNAAAKDKNLLIAVKKGDLNQVKQCFVSGAHANCQDTDGRTPIQIAIQNKDVAITEYFLNLGVKVHHALPDGSTPLSWAKQYADDKIVQLCHKYEN